MMTDLMRYLETIVDEVNRGVSLIDTRDAADILNVLYRAERIFLAGSGRSGLAVRAFANRLTQLGKVAYMVGDVTTPSIQAGDVLLPMRRQQST
jgi:6-phospho-3-hexuloisomerase